MPDELSLIHIFAAVAYHPIYRMGAPHDDLYFSEFFRYHTKRTARGCAYRRLHGGTDFHKSCDTAYASGNRYQRDSDLCRMVGGTFMGDGSAGLLVHENNTDRHGFCLLYTSLRTAQCHNPRIAIFATGNPICLAKTG